MSEGVWIDPARQGGLPCIAGHRYPLTNVLIELSSDDSPALGMFLCENDGLTAREVREALAWAARHFDRPFDPETMEAIR